MTVYSHDTRVETLERRKVYDGFGGIYDTLTKVTQSNGDTEFLVYFGGTDPFGFDNEASARKFYDDVQAPEVLAS